VNGARRKLMAGALAAAGALALGAVARAAPARPRVIKVVAKKFNYTPNRIELKTGEAVVLELTALDFVHGLSIPGMDVRLDLPPGQVTRVPLRPAAAGRFALLCDNFCGSGHEEMSGTIIVRD
jgi:cytochrome c oxidase subunit 2